MKSFQTLRKKRTADDDVGKTYFGSSSPTKEKVVCIKVILKMIDPYCLGVYFEKEDGSTPYYWPLLAGIEKGEDWCTDLDIGM